MRPTTPGRTWTAAEDERRLELRRQGMPRAAIAAELDRTVPSVAGRLDGLGARKRTPRWSRDDDYRLAALIEQHIPYAVIARRLGRSTDAVIIRCKRAGIARLRTANGWSLNQVAAMLGVRCNKTVSWWANQGWLRAHAAGTRLNRRDVRDRVVEDADLWRFLEDERYWHLWEPCAIPDSALRDWAIEQRRGLRYVGTREAGRLLGLSEGAIRDRIGRGVLKAVRHGGENWLIRSDWLVYEPGRTTKGRRCPRPRMSDGLDWQPSPVPPPAGIVAWEIARAAAANDATPPAPGCSHA